MNSNPFGSLDRAAGLLANLRKIIFSNFTVNKYILYKFFYDTQATVVV